MRSGTLPVHQIVGMGEAYRIAKEEMDTEYHVSEHCAIVYTMVLKTLKKPM